MNGDQRPKPTNTVNSSHLPQTFSETIDQIQRLVLPGFVQQASQEQLFYHNEEHVQAVQRRSHQIFAVVAPWLEPDVDRDRMRFILDLCAMTHDLVQQFDPLEGTHTPRHRQSGANEIATIDQLMHAIHQVNEQITPPLPNKDAHLNEADLAVVRQAIAATICTYDAQERSIYQPLLSSGEPLSIVARILALADLGTLGMEGIDAFNHEGSLLFLEENPDVVALLQKGGPDLLENTSPELAENIRQRLLQRCRFQVNFARSRLARFASELEGFPPATISALKSDTFRHLTPETVQQVAAITPTHPQTPLDQLLAFFQFERYL